jgi:C1A family cysteine protease
VKTILLFFIIGLAAAQANAEERTYSSKSYPTPMTTGFQQTAASLQFLRTAPRISFLSATTPVVGAFSMRGKIGPVEDQGWCHSCWSFALTTALRGTLKSTSKDPGRLSFNYLLNCNNAGMNCNGGDFAAAELLVSPHGSPAYGSDGAYTGSDGSCDPQPPVASALSYKLLGPDFGTHAGHPSPSFKDIAYVVGVLHKPVAVDIAADWNWTRYSSGIFNSCSGEGGINHMVVIEGYDCGSSTDKAGNCVFDKEGNLPPGVGTWIIRNSHGASWGDHGYITMKATGSDGSRCNGAGVDALYFEAK